MTKFTSRSHGYTTTTNEPTSPWENGYNESFMESLGMKYLTQRYSIQSKKHRC